MRILFLTYQGGIAGSTHSIRYLTEGLSNLGHDIYLGCPVNSFLHTSLENSKVHLIPMTFRSKVDMACVHHIYQIVKEYDIQVINTQSSRDRYLVMLAKLLYGFSAKIIHTRRQMCKSMGGPLAVLTTLTSKGIIAVSEEVKKSLVRKGFNRQQISIIPNGTPDSKYDCIDDQHVSELKEIYNITASDIVLGVVSRLKDQGDLIKALPYLPFNVKVIFVGINESDIQAINPADVRDHTLYFTGKIASSEALAHYRLFTIKILPSRMEGLSQSLLEAMFLQVPVVATAEGGNLSLVKHEENGLLFSHNHPLQLAIQIERLIHNPSLRKRLIENASKMVRTNYSIKNTIIAYEEYFKEILTGSDSILQVDHVFS